MQFDSEIAAKMSPGEVFTKSYTDPVFFANYFLKEHFKLVEDIPFFHRAMLAIMTRKVDFLAQYGEVEKILQYFPNYFKLNEDGKLVLSYAKNTLLVLPRGFGKTIVTKMFIVWSMLYQKYQNILFISESSTHSIEQCKDIRGIFEYNEDIRKIFGEKVPVKNSKENRIWSNEEIQTRDDIFLITRGRGGQIRGLNRKGNVRPDLIIVDDVEDEESVATEEQRQKCRQWFFSAVKPALSRNEHATMIACGTILHRDSLLSRLLTSTEWVNVKLSAKFPDGSVLWEERFPNAWIEREKQLWATMGTLMQFYLEYMSEHRNVEEAIFRPEMFIIQTRKPEEFVVTSLAIDPAISQAITADFCAFAVCGKTDEGKTHLIDCYAKRGMHPREQVEKYFELSIKHQVTNHGVESIAYQAALISMITEAQARYGRYFQIEPIKHKTKRKIAYAASWRRVWDLVGSQCKDTFQTLKLNAWIIPPITTTYPMLSRWQSDCLIRKICSRIILQEKLLKEHLQQGVSVHEPF